MPTCMRLICDPQCWVLYFYVRSGHLENQNCNCAFILCDDFMYALKAIIHHPEDSHAAVLFHRDKAADARQNARGLLDDIE